MSEGRIPDFLWPPGRSTGDGAHAPRVAPYSASIVATRAEVEEAARHPGLAQALDLEWMMGRMRRAR